MAIDWWVTLSDTDPTTLYPGLQASLTVFTSLILAPLLLLGCEQVLDIWFGK